MIKYPLLILILFMLSTPALAGWSQDGVPLQTIEHGTVNGGIYVGGGHGKEYTISYTQNFIVPSGTVRWARLYVSAKDTTWINVSINGHLLGNYTNLTDNPKVYVNYQEDRSMYWAYYNNVVDYIVNGSNTATADLGSGVGLNTKSWGIVLIAVYEGGDAPELIEYWVNEGNPLLHYDQPPFAAHHNTTNTSFADITDLNDMTSAALHTAYIWGSEEGDPLPHDTLWFNSALIAEDASDGGGTDDQGNLWRGACFDLEKWDASLIEENNVILYDRGGDNLLSPVLAVLVLKRGTEPAANQTVHLGASIIPAIAFEVNLSSMDFGDLAPGETSKGKNLTIMNKGSFSINISAQVSDRTENLFADGVLLNESSWKLYSAVIPKNGDDKPVAKLHVPDDYTGAGNKEGTLMFWAKKAA